MKKNVIFRGRYNSNPLSTSEDVLSFKWVKLILFYWNFGVCVYTREKQRISVEKNLRGVLLKCWNIKMKTNRQKTIMNVNGRYLVNCRRCREFCRHMQEFMLIPYVNFQKRIKIIFIHCINIILHILFVPYFSYLDKQNNWFEKLYYNVSYDLL